MTECYVIECCPVIFTIVLIFTITIITPLLHCHHHHRPGPPSAPPLISHCHHATLRSSRHGGERIIRDRQGLNCDSQERGGCALIGSQPNYVYYLRLKNLKHRVLHLAGTKNLSWTDRCQKSGRFEIKQFQVLSTMISNKYAILSD